MYYKYSCNEDVIIYALDKGASIFGQIQRKIAFNALLKYPNKDKTKTFPPPPPTYPKYTHPSNDL